jgi:hypothetical protein
VRIGHYEKGATTGEQTMVLRQQERGGVDKRREKRQEERGDKERREANREIVCCNMFL